jgi:hypothetical protein
LPQSLCGQDAQVWAGALADVASASSRRRRRWRAQLHDRFAKHVLVNWIRRRRRRCACWCPSATAARGRLCDRGGLLCRADGEAQQPGAQRALPQGVEEPCQNVVRPGEPPFGRCARLVAACSWGGTGPRGTIDRGAAASACVCCDFSPPRRSRDVLHARRRRRRSRRAPLLACCDLPCEARRSATTPRFAWAAVSLWRSSRCVVLTA